MTSTDPVTTGSSDQRHMKEGEGWRLGWDPSGYYCGLIAGQAWALELTADEWQDFCRLALQLAETMATMQAELMDAERITCEAETARLWLEAEGFPHCYSLRVILLSGRRGEGTWLPSAVPNLIRAIQGLTIF